MKYFLCLPTNFNIPENFNKLLNQPANCQQMEPVFPHPGHSFVAQPCDKVFLVMSIIISLSVSPVDPAVEASVGPSQRSDVGRGVRVNVGKRILKNNLEISVLVFG